jgi:SOS-response transcriptional repressor LexA
VSNYTQDRAVHFNQFVSLAAQQKVVADFPHTKHNANLQWRDFPLRIELVDDRERASRMLPLGTMLAEMRAARRLDAAGFAQLLNSAPEYLARVEAGAIFPPAAKRRAWAAALGYADLLDFDARWRAPLAGSARAARAAPAGLIPVVNAAPAGPPVDYQEFGLDTAVGYDYVPRADTPEQQSADFLFAVIIVGDSMSPAYQDGDLVVFRPLAPDESLPAGQAVFIRFAASRDHTCTFKRLFCAGSGRADDSPRYELRPDNPAQASLLVDAQEIDRIAVAIERRPGYAALTEARGICRVADQYAQVPVED